MKHVLTIRLFLALSLLTALQGISVAQGLKAQRFRGIQLIGPTSRNQTNQKNQGVALLAPPNMSNSYSLVFPTTAGANGQVLTIVDNGFMGWSTPLTDSTGWSTLGNLLSDSTTMFLGTKQSNTADMPLIIKTDGNERMRILGGSGFVGIGTAAPTAQLQIVPSRDSVTSLLLKMNANQKANAFEIDDNLARELFTISANGAVSLRPYANPPGSTNELRFVELTGNGTNFIGFKAPDVIAGDRIWTLPAADGSANQALTTDGAGVLGWQSVLLPSTGWTLTGNGGTTSSGALGATPTGSRLGTTDAVDLRFVTANTTRMIVSADGSITMGGTLGVTGLTTLSSGVTVTGTTLINSTGAAATTIGNTGSNVTIGSVGGTVKTSVGANDRIVLANSSGLLDQASISSVVAAGIAGNAWALSGNTGYTASGSLGGAPTGSFLGSTTALPLNIVTNNAIRMIVSSDGAVSTQRDLTVNGITVGRGTGSDATNTAVGSGVMSISGGSYNTALGYQALQGPGLGSNNVAIGNFAMQNSGGVTMASNVAVGSAALQTGQGIEHVALGSGTLVNLSNSNAQSVVAVGAYSGVSFSANPTNNNLTNASYSVYLGGYSRPLANGGTYENVIGYDAVGNGNYTTTIGSAQQLSTHIRGHLNLNYTQANNLAPELRLFEASVNGTNYTAFRAPLALDANITYTLPAVAPTANGQVLSSTTGGTMSWISGLTTTTGWALAGNTGYTASGSLGGAPTGSFLGSTTALALNIVTNNAVRMIVASDGSISMGSGIVSVNADQNFATNINTGTSTGAVNIGTGTNSGTVTIGRTGGTLTTIGSLGHTGAATVTGTTLINSTGAAATTIGNTGSNVTIGSVGGTVKTSVGANDRIVLANSSGLLDQASISSVVAAGIAGNAWALSGNAGTTSGGTLGAAATGNFIGTTDNQSLSLGTGGIVHVQIASGRLQTFTDIVVNGVQIGRGASASFAGHISNTVVGNGAMPNIIAGSLAVNNSAFGRVALSAVDNGRDNTALGFAAMEKNVNGDYNTAVGSGAFGVATAGSNNVAVGWRSLYNTDAAALNNATAVGYQAGRYVTGATGLTAFGNGALSGTSVAYVTGANNTAIGQSAGSGVTSGAENVFVGSAASIGTPTDNNSIVIGANTTGLGSNTVVLGNSSIVTTALRGNVLINNSGSNTPGAVRFLEGSSGGSNFIGLRAPTSVTADFTYTLPSTAPLAGQMLISTSDGTMSWATGLTSMTGWALSGNTGYTASGSLGGAPTGSFLGSTTALPLNIVTNNAIRMIVSSDGVVSTEKDIVVNGVRVGRGVAGSGGSVVLGSDALIQASAGLKNTALGQSSLMATTGAENTAAGFQAGYGLSTGDKNVLLGHAAGYTLTAGSENVFIGWGANLNSGSVNKSITIGASTSSGSNSVTIGYLASGSSKSVVIGDSAQGESNSIAIGNDRNENPAAANTAVLGKSAITLTRLYGTLRVNTIAGTAKTALGSNDRILVASSDGSFDQASISTVVAAGVSGSAWSLTGNNIGTSSGALGAAPTGSFLGTTAGNTQPLNIVTNNAIRMIVSSNGVVSTQRDMTVNGITVGQGANSGWSTAVGASAMSNAGGSNNTAMGTWSLQNSTGKHNVAVGAVTGRLMTTGSNNVLIGSGAMQNAGTDSNNVVIGLNALGNGGSNQSVVVGTNAQSMGNDIVMIGDSATNNNVASTGSVVIGAGANVSGTNSIAIGNNTTVTTANTVSLGNTSIITTNLQGNVLINNSSGNAGQVRFLEANASGANYIGLRAPSSLASDFTYTLPTTAPTAGQVLSSATDGTMSWVTGATLSSTGTTNRLSKFSSATGLADSRVSDDGTDITVGVGQTSGAINIGPALTTGTVSIGGTSQTGLIAVGNGTSATKQIIEIGRYGNKSIQIGSESNADNEIFIVSRKTTTFYGPEIAFRANTSGTTTAPVLRLHEDYPGSGITPDHVGLKAPAVLSASQVYTLPASAPAVDNQVLSSAMDGTMSWISALTPTTGWALAGNNIGTSSGALGAAPTGSFLGTTAGSTQPLNIVTNNAIRMIVSSDGVVSTEKDVVVNGVTIGRGGGSVSGNTAVGFNAMAATATGGSNAAFGFAALTAVTGGAGNVGVGFWAGRSITNGSGNVAVGRAALQTVADSTGNTAIGHQSLYSTTGGLNTALGHEAGYSATSGRLGLYLGAGSVPLNATDINSIVIGASTVGLGSNTVVLGNSSIVTTALRGNVLINNSGSNTPGAVRFLEGSSGGSNFIGLRAPTSVTADFTYTLPTTAPTAGQVLSSATDGTMSWVSGLTTTTGWALAGNTGYTASGSLGGAPTGSFLGSTTALALNIVTNNAIRMIVASDGSISMGSGIVSVNADQNFATNINTGTSTGAVNIGGATGSQTISIGAGASTANTQTINIGTGGSSTAIKNLTLGSTNSTSSTSIQSGSSGVSINASVNAPTNINTGTSTGAVNIGTGTNSGTVTIGRTGGTLTTIGSLGHTGAATITGTTLINSTGTAATTIGNSSGANVTVGSVGGTVKSSVGSNDRIVLANSSGLLDQASISSVVAAGIAGNAWALAGNGTSDAWNGSSGARLGTTSAQPLVLATTNSTAQDIRFYTGASGANERMRITGAGNVGVGEVTPLSMLQVTAFLQTNIGLIIKASNLVSVSPPPPGPGVPPGGTLGNLLELRSATDDILFFASNSGSLVLRPYGTSAGNTNEIRFRELVANGSNDVGFKAPDNIGSDVMWTLPSSDGSTGQMLTTNGSGTLSWSSGLTTTTGWALAGNNTSDAWNGSTGSRLGTTSAQPLVLATTNATAQDIRFFTGANGTSERMRITGAGLVLIGSTTGTRTLDVTGTVGATGLVTAGAGVNLSGTTSPLQANGSAGTTGQVLTSAGAGNTPTWTNAQAAAGIKAKGRSAALANVTSFAITPVTNLDADDGISVTLEGDGTGMATPSFYVVRTTGASGTVTVYFSSGYSGRVTWVVID